MGYFNDGVTIAIILFLIVFSIILLVKNNKKDNEYKELTDKCLELCDKNGSLASRNNYLEKKIREFTETQFLPGDKVMVKYLGLTYGSGDTKESFKIDYEGYIIEITKTQIKLDVLVVRESEGSKYPTGMPNPVNTLLEYSKDKWFARIDSNIEVILDTASTRDFKIDNILNP